MFLLAFAFACISQLPFLFLLQTYGVHSSAGAVGYLFYLPADFLLNWLFPAGFVLGETAGWFAIQALLITLVAFLFLISLRALARRTAN